jgi:ketosteroid isomerase-like protein
MKNENDVKEINARYRAYCDACQAGDLEKVPSFWSLPALFALDTKQPETSQLLLETPAEMVKLYSTLFGSSTGVDKTIIDESEVMFFGDKLATIRTSLRHMIGEKLHDKQVAIYGCRKVAGEWIFFSHISVDEND